MKYLLFLLLISPAYADNLISVDQVGSGNSINITQTDNWKQFELQIIGNNNSVSVSQEGLGNHSANIRLENNGGPSSIVIHQSGVTNKSYSIQQTCTNPAGCSVSVTQQ